MKLWCFQTICLKEYNKLVLQQNWCRQIKPTSEGRNFTRLTSLSPLQGGGDINLGGQRRTSTNVTIDGLILEIPQQLGEIGRGPYTISQEAIREFEVSTNDYDVAQGRQGGGSITQ
jgi:hypothetical protein